MSEDRGWPDATRPGVPDGFDAYGWHWLRSESGDTIGRWIASMRTWWISGSERSPVGVAQRYAYLGPVLSPTEATTLRTERDAALAEAQELRLQAITDMGQTQTALEEVGRLREALRLGLAGINDLADDILDLENGETWSPNEPMGVGVDAMIAALRQPDEKGPTP